MMPAMTEEQRLFVERVFEAQGILHRICAVWNHSSKSMPNDTMKGCEDLEVLNHAVKH